MSYVFRRSQIRLKHHRHMFPFILAITCMLLVQFYSIIVARKWRQEYISYCTELFKHLFSQYDPIHRITDAQSNYHEGNSFFLVHFLKRSSKTREGETRTPHLFSGARAHPPFVLKKHWHLLYSFKNFELYMYPKTDVKKPTC